jgi:hypothetical protein
VTLSFPGGELTLGGGDFTLAMTMKSGASSSVQSPSRNRPRARRAASLHSIAQMKRLSQRGFRGSKVCAVSDSNFSKLRITRAYINLLCLPQDDVGMISLAWIGNYEIRMLDVSQTGAADEPLFLIELYDHDAQMQLDRRLCYEIEQGAAAFEAFVAR